MSRVGWLKGPCVLMDHFDLCMKEAHSRASCVHHICPIWFPLSTAFLFLPWGLDYLWVNNKRREVWWVFGTHVCAFGMASPNVIELSLFVLFFFYFGLSTLIGFLSHFIFLFVVLFCYFVLVFNLIYVLLSYFIYLLFTNLFCLWNWQKIAKKRESLNECKSLFRIALWYELVNVCIFSWIMFKINYVF